MKKFRVVVDFMANELMTEGQAKRAIEDILKQVHPMFWRAHGILPSSVKAKQFSRVVASEYVERDAEAETAVKLGDHNFVIEEKTNVSKGLKS